MTIKEVSEKMHISADTLRYYEKIGMIPSVKRNSSGIRDYDEEDLRWIQLALCMRLAGLPVDSIVQYLALYQQGDSTINERVQLLKMQKETLLDSKRNIEIMLERLDRKIENYENQIGKDS